MIVRLFDGMNYLRISLESDPTGTSQRTLLNEALTSTDIDVWVWDGAGNNKRRREIYPDYKLGRKTMPEDIRTSMELLKVALAYTKATQVCVPGYEADDVIATLALRHAPAAVYSNDFDFFQLTVNPHIYVGCKPKAGVPAGLVRTYKTLVGDPADNIKGIPGFGDKTWAEADHAAWVAYLKQLARDPTYGGEPPPAPKRVLNWLQDGQNRLLLSQIYSITGFYTVPDELIDQHTTLGKPCKAAVDHILSEFFL